MPDTSIIPYLVWFWESNRIKLDGYEQPIIQWHHTDLPNTFKLLLSHSNLAHSVCYNVIDNNVQQTDCISERLFFTSWPRQALLTTSHSMHSVMHLPSSGWALAGLLPTMSLGTGSC